MINFKKLVVLGLSLLLTGGIVGTGVSAIVNDSETKVEAADTYYIAVKNNKNWSQVNCYYWEGASSTWPGPKMKQVTINGENNWYYIEISGQPTKCIFSNNGSSQTADLEGITYSEKCAIATSIGVVPSANHIFKYTNNYVMSSSQITSTSTGRMFATWGGSGWDSWGAQLGLRLWEHVSVIKDTPFVNENVYIYQFDHYTNLPSYGKYFGYVDVEIRDYEGAQFVRCGDKFDSVWNWPSNSQTNLVFDESFFTKPYVITGNDNSNDGKYNSVQLKADDHLAKKVLEAYYSCSDNPYNGYKRIDDLKSNFFGDGSTYDPEATITDYDNSGAYEDTYEGLSHTSSVKIGDKIAFMEAKNSGVSSANPLLTNSINSNNSTLIIVLASITAIGLISVLFITFKRKRA